VFQDPDSSLDPSKTIGFLLEEPLAIHRAGSRAERDRRVDEVLELVGLDSSYKRRRVYELSGGQKQRICIGCALVLEPDLIVADEAVSALDVSVGAQILNLFRDLHERLGLSLFFISHNLNLVYYLCDTIAVMYRGEIVEKGEAEKLYAAPEHPYTKALLEAAPGIDRPPQGGV
jgi:ABC-type glutathione transport system ATPase component